MKKLVLMLAALCGMLPAMASDTSPTAAGRVQRRRLNVAADAVDAALGVVRDVESVASDLENGAESVAEAARDQLDNASNRGKRWADNVGNFFTSLNKQRHDRGISNWDAGFGLGSLGALGTWLAYHGWKTRQARRQLALEKAKSKLATLQKKVQQAKTPEARSQALFEYRKAQREAINVFKHKNSWSRDWTDRLRGAWQGDYGWQHQVASAIAPALFATALTTHGIGHYQRNKAEGSNSGDGGQGPQRAGLRTPRALERRASLPSPSTPVSPTASDASDVPPIDTSLSPEAQALFQRIRDNLVS